MLVKGVTGWSWKGAKAWHSRHFLVSLVVSLYLSGQYTPWRSIFLVSICVPLFPPASPVWISSRSDWPSVWATHLSLGASYPLFYICIPFMANCRALNLIFLASARLSLVFSLEEFAWCYSFWMNVFTTALHLGIFASYGIWLHRCHWHDWWWLVSRWKLIDVLLHPLVLGEGMREVLRIRLHC